MFLFNYVKINLVRLILGGYLMEEKAILDCAKHLVEITIQKHRDKLLGKEKMSEFIKDNLIKVDKDIDYNEVLHLYSKYLAKEGYEIKKDINKFDIIDYNSEEFELYINNL